MSAAIYFDGKSNRRHHVELRFADTLDIAQAERTLVSWSYPNIRIVDAPTGTTRLWCAGGEPLARLQFRDPDLRREIDRLCPNLTGPGGAQPVSAGRIALWSAAAAAVIVGLIWFSVPLLANEIAEIMPVAWEKPLGEAVDRQTRVFFNGGQCTAPGGVAALNKLVRQLQVAARLPVKPDPIVLTSAIPNAFALPGGRVYVLSALLRDAAGPDELAGVLAHEFGHVSHRDGLRRLIRDGGTGYLVGLLFGDVGGAGAALFAVRSLLNAAYARDDETRADAFAIVTMHRLGRPTAPLGRLLTRIAGAGDQDYSVLSDHPMTSERARLLEEPFTGTLGPPLLTADEWRALKAICDVAPPPARDGGKTDGLLKNHSDLGLDPDFTHGR